MLTLNMDLPQGVLVGGDPAQFAALLNRVGAAWYSAMPEDLECDDTLAITGWRASTQSPLAQPAEPNRQASFYKAAPGLSGLDFVAERNCGFAVPGITQNAASFSFAVRFDANPGEMRSLLTLNLAARRNYVFLAEADGQIIFKTQDNSGSVSLPIGPRDQGPRWLVAGYSGGRFYLARAGDTPVVADALQRDVGGAGDLFIGCRSHRPGLLKTLGAGVISDVIFWPANILDKADATARMQADAFEAHVLWSA
jgi:hypothetical protein